MSLKTPAAVLAFDSVGALDLWLPVLILDRPTLAAPLQQVRGSVAVLGGHGPACELEDELPVRIL